MTLRGRGRRNGRDPVDTGPAQPAGASRHDPPAGPPTSPQVAVVPAPAPPWLRGVAAWSWRLLVSVAALALVVWAVDKVLLAFVAAFLALVFTAILLPLVGVLDRWVPRGLATVLAVVLGIAVVTGALAFVVMSVANQWAELERQVDEAADALVRLIRDRSIPVPLPEEDVQSWAQQARSWLRQHESQVMQYALTGLSTLGFVLTTLALAVFLTVFFLLRGDAMWHWCLNQLPSRVRETWHAGGEAAWAAFGGYTAGTFLIAAFDAVLAFLLLLALGVPLAAPLAVLVFIGALVPLVGAPAAMLVAMVVALVANGVVNAALVGIGIALIGQLEGHVLEPLIMGRAVQLHPVVVGLAVTVGALVAGILGAVLAVPVVATGWAVFARLRTPDPPTDFHHEDAGGEDGS